MRHSANNLRALVTGEVKEPNGPEGVAWPPYLYDRPPSIVWGLQETQASPGRVAVYEQLCATGAGGGPRVWEAMCVCVCGCVHVSGWYCRRLPAFFAHQGAGSQAGKIHDCFYSCPPSSHVASQALTPRLAAAPCAHWAGVGTCWKGKVLGAGQGLLGLVLGSPFLGY